MFWLHDLLFVLCSLDLNALHTQRIMGFFYLNRPFATIGHVTLATHPLTTASPYGGWVPGPLPWLTIPATQP